MALESTHFCQFTTGTRLYQKACQLRDTVLRRPIGLSLFDENLSGESGQLHFGLVEGTDLLACVTIDLQGDTDALLRQMCVVPDRQQQGLGRRLITQVEAHLVQRKVQRVTMSARITAVGFYESLGYRTHGAEYLSVGIPHISMQKKL